MAHGIMYDSRLKHDQIVTIKTLYPGFGNSKDFRANFKFVQDIYAEVASEYGIKLPKTWVVADELLNSDKHLKKHRWLLEPLGPVIIVNSSYNPLQYFYANQTKGTVLHHVNWREHAKQFFMVANSAKKALENNRENRRYFLCEKWRAKSFYLIYK